jgi:hypothetical protein
MEEEPYVEHQSVEQRYEQPAVEEDDWIVEGDDVLFAFNLLYMLSRDAHIQKVLDASSGHYEPLRLRSFLRSRRSSISHGGQGYA